MGVLVDLTKCSGCRQCEAACKQAAGFEVPSDEELKDRSVFAQYRRPDPRSYTVVNEFVLGDDEAGDRSMHAKINCLHCADPACVSACLVGALQKEPNGAVTYDPWKCMGCRYCMVACPFQMPTYEYDNALTPQVRKCTFCSNEGNPNKGGVPACVQACPKEGLTYGRRDELLARAHQKIKERPDLYVDHVYGEHEAGGTSWLYLSGVPFEQIGFLQMNGKAPPRLTETIQHSVFKHALPPLALYGLLGAIMWLTKDQDRDAETADQSQDESTTMGGPPRRASAVKTDELTGVAQVRGEAGA
jgi:Fe-S-cluster-containing dehydrogenase component